MISEFKNHIQRSFPFLKGKKLLVASSGGIDSMVLTNLLIRYGYQISIAHCNFQLREKESDLDDEFVKNSAKKLHIPCHTILFDTKDYAGKRNISIQMAARDLRYDWFKNLMQEQDLDYLLTAHHADDNLETFLINLSRGTGLEGLTGIPPINNNIIRPLLPFSRKEIEQYAKENQISWREDQSNKETKYLRNKLRHDIIPLLKELNPNFMSSFANTLDYLKGSEQIVNDRIDKVKEQLVIKKDGISKFDINKLKSLSDPKAYLFELLKTHGFTEWDDIFALLDAQSGKLLVSKTHRLLKNRQSLILSTLPIESQQLKRVVINDFVTNVKIDGFRNEKKGFVLKFQQMSLMDYNEMDIKKNPPNIACIDKDLLKLPLFVRKWNNGDYFYPIGLQGRKKLSKYFKDEKLSLLEKENTWLLCSKDDIVWVIGKRMDDRYKITNKTKNVLKITTTP